MASRTIVTSQPDVACDVCGRRLLRGEQPDIFIDAGRRRTVCELCAPRAAHEGWMRETGSSSLELPPSRPRRGRSFIDRLMGRGPARPAGEHAPAAENPPRRVEAYPAAARRSLDAVPLAEPADFEPVQLDDGVPASSPAVAEPAAAAAPSAAGPDYADPTWPEIAVEAFNESEFPRRVAGVARSLGAPEVSVRSAEHHEAVVQIVVAWELCWYRYEADMSEGRDVQVVDQGTELDELPRRDRLGNAVAAEDGRLELIAAV